MKKSKIRSWISRQGWKIAKVRTGIDEFNTPFCKKYVALQHILNPATSKLNLTNQLKIDIATRNI